MNLPGTPDVICKDNKYFEELREGSETRKPFLGCTLSLGRSEHKLARQLIVWSTLAAYIGIGASGPSNMDSMTDVGNDEKEYDSRSSHSNLKTKVFSALFHWSIEKL